MSTQKTDKSLSHAEIAREIRRLHPESRASSNMVGQVRRGDTASATLSALIPEAIKSLEAKAARAAKRVKRAAKVKVGVTA